ncbi:MAG TPA: HD domain-containing protein [Bacteroidales bacterium]|nr:HD domain-containing protein [Bacteroidales bacterium]
MQALKFRNVAINPGNPGWSSCIRRELRMYQKRGDIRSDFSRDYNRLLHCKAYRRLKHKTQVFYATQNDHVCTRIEHVTHVASVSYSIASFLGLNTELTQAIAIGHDLGHAPFGHEGEYILRKIALDELGESFWHEKNSLFFVDKLETLPDLQNKEKNLNLTYAVRDGIISHCGEVNENAIFPRKEFIRLEEIVRPNQYAPYTWEACVVKIADKISYLGRDIEDALTLKILDKDQIAELSEIVTSIKKIKVWQINNTILMNDFIINLCRMSTPEKGILFSEKYLNMINSVKAFNYKHIYKHKRLDYYGKLASLVINSIYSALASLYVPKDRLMAALSRQEAIYPSLIGAFKYWLVKYSDICIEERRTSKFGNELVYDYNNEADYKRSILHYISSMTDHFAMKLFGELTRF